MTTELVAESIIAQNTCGFSGCLNEPAWRVGVVRIQTTDGGECELAGYEDEPINRVCDDHKRDKATHKMIVNKAWAIVLRSIESENPGLLAQIGKKFRMKHFDIGWVPV